MYEVLQGIRVVEVAEWIFVPAAGQILADWGADVVKLEHPVRGDAVRGLSEVNFEVGNRGKRSIGLDIGSPAGREILDRLIDGADIFLTSFMEDARKRLRIEPSDVMARNPRIIYARGTGHGLLGPAANKGGYDFASTWCRTGIAFRLTAPGGQPPGMPGSVGDLTGATALAGAIAAALFRRERTGQGGIVDHSLYAAGTWIMSQALVRESAPERFTEAVSLISANPLVRLYPTKDGRWILLNLLQPDRFWAEFCRVLGREDLIDDPRFHDMDARNENGAECVEVLTAVFTSRTFAEWLDVLDTFSGVWAPVQSPAEVLADPIALENSYVVPVTSPDGRTYLGAAPPGQFDEAPIGELRASPEVWQHTEEVLLELGFDWPEIIELKEAGTIP